MHKNILAVILFTFFFTSLLAQEKQELDCKFFSVNQGLSQYDVSAIIQDDLGYLWFGTYDGLNRFDGAQNTIFRHKSTFLFETIRNNRILTLTKDQNENIWIGTEGGGISVFNLKKGIFFDIQTNELEEIIHYGVIPSLCTLKDGRILFSTTNGDLFFLTTKKIDIKHNILQLVITKLEYDTQQIPVGKYPSSLVEYNGKLLIGCRNRGLFELRKNAQNKKYRTTLINQNSITTILLDGEENIWIGSFSGLMLFRYYNNYLQYLNLSSRIPKSISSKVVISSICEDNQHQKWIGTSSSGLFMISKANKNVDEYKIENYSIENSSLHSNRISHVFIDKSNILWIGSQEDGVAFSDLSNKKFSDLTLNYNQKGISNVFVSSIYPDNYDNIWIGTEDKGLFRIDKSNNKIENYSVGFFADQKQSTITSTLEDKWGNLWFTTWNGCFYISKQNLLSGLIKIHNLTYDKLSNYLNASFYSIAESQSGDLWLGSDMGLFRVKRTANGSISNIRLYFSSKQNSNNYQIYAIATVSDNSLIIGTKGHGAKLITFSDKDYKLKVDEFKEDHLLKIKKLTNNNVWAVGIVDGKIWVGTDEGINLLVKKNNAYEVESTEKLNENLGFSKIVSIMTDQKGFIWFGTTIGAVRFNLKTNTPEILTNTDGLKSNVISAIALRKLDDVLYFGSIKGVNYSALKDLSSKKILVDPKITRIRINGNDILNTPENSNGNSIFDIPFQKVLDLPYNQNNISLSISTFDFFNPSATDYQYRMVGRDDEWTLARNGEKLIVYQSLPPGNYEFQLKSTKTSVDNKQNLVSLTFHINTPPWKQWWAVIFYLIILSVGLVFLFRFLRWRIRFSNELKMEKYRHQQDKELSDLKNKLFVNISHELRTPLTLIISPVKEITKFELDSKISKLFKIVEYNANRLLLLTNQLLDAERNDRLILNVEKRDIVKHIQLIAANFEPLAKEKNIKISEIYQTECILCYYDTDIIEKIVSNLILNAIKYTKEEGIITVKCESTENENEMLNIVVQDNGKGISKEKIDNIFAMYYQVDKSNGYGVGLSVVKQMVESHHGSINVNSEEGSGSTFIVKIPVSKNEYFESQSTKSGINSVKILDYKEADISSKKQLNSILIVEDNHDLREYLAQSLRKYFEVHTAENGEEGIKKATQVIPDLIVTDIMMPVMSGIEMAKAAFVNDTIRHIPIIFLTAKGNPDNQLEGIQLGAIDYLIKPVDIDILKSKIDNHIRIIRLNREKMRNIYLQTTDENIENTVDADFIKKAQKIILKSISDTSFDVSKLASDMALSKIQLHRRFKSVMDVSPGEFIRLTRLKTAYQHLTSGINNVSEIVLMTGFENHSHFTKIVKKQFGKTPQQIITENKNIKT